MADRAEKSRRDRREPHPLAVLAGVLAVFLLLAACYVGYQALAHQNGRCPRPVSCSRRPRHGSEICHAERCVRFQDVTPWCGMPWVSSGRDLGGAHIEPL